MRTEPAPVHRPGHTPDPASVPDPATARVALATATVLAVSLLPRAALAQDPPPATDLWVAELRVGPGGALEVGEPRNVTDRPGYDNQPAFTPDGRAILFTSIRGDGQADTWIHDLESGQTLRLTVTPESEYSPTPLPGGGGFSVIRVEADSTQRLWAFDPDGRSARLLLAGVAPVGYHAWADDETVAVFVLGDPPTLRVAEPASGRVETIVSGIGRSLQRVPGRRSVSFIRKESETEWWLEELDVADGTTRRLVRTPQGREDHAWTPDGRVLMGDGTRLLAWDPQIGGEWTEAADLSGAGVAGITRLAVSPRGDRIALVAERR